MKTRTKRLSLLLLTLACLLGAGTARAQTQAAHSIYNSAVDQINCETIRFIHREAGRDAVAGSMDCRSYDGITKSIPADEAQTTLQVAKSIDAYKGKFSEGKPLDQQLDKVIQYATKRIEAKKRKGDVGAYKKRLDKIKTDAIANMEAAPESPADSSADEGQTETASTDTAGAVAAPQKSASQPAGWASTLSLIFSIVALGISGYVLYRSGRAPKQVAFENKNEEKLWRRKVLEDGWEERFKELEDRLTAEVETLRAKYRDDMAEITASTGYTAPEMTEAEPVAAEAEAYRSPETNYASYTPSANISHPLTEEEEEEEDAFIDEPYDSNEEDDEEEEELNGHAVLSEEEESPAEGPEQQLPVTIVFELEETEDEEDEELEEAIEDEYAEPESAADETSNEEEEDTEEEVAGQWEELPEAGETDIDVVTATVDTQAAIHSPIPEETDESEGTDNEDGTLEDDFEDEESELAADEEEEDIEEVITEEEIAFNTYVKPSPEFRLEPTGPEGEEGDEEGMPYYRYAGTPAADGSFALDVFTDSPDADSIYEIELYDEVPNKAFFSLLPYPETVEKALSDPERYLAPCCTYDEDPQGKEIIVLIDEGQLRRQDDRWTVSKKARIRFE